MKIKKYILLISILVIMILISVILISASSETLFSKAGTNTKDFLENEQNEKKIIAKINGYPIYENEVEFIKESYELFGRYDISEEDIVKRLAIEYLLLEKARECNIIVTFDEARENLLETIRSIKGNDEEYMKYTAYIEAAGLTEEEYIEKMIPVYQEAMMRGRYMNEVIDQGYINSDEYFDDYKDELLEDADFVYYK